MINFDCTNCAYFTSIGASMDNPYPEIYCSKHSYDFSYRPEPEHEEEYMKICDDFEMSRYTKEQIKINRKKKLERICSDLNK